MIYEEIDSLISDMEDIGILNDNIVHVNGVEPGKVPRESN